MKYDCDVIRDLIPLCIDKVASKNSQNAVSEHIAECRTCLAAFKKMQQQRLTAPTYWNVQFVRKLRVYKYIGIIKPILASFLLFLLLAFLAWQGFTIGYHHP